MSSIISTTPKDLQTNVSLNEFFKVQFDTDLDPETITEDTVILAREENVIVKGVTGYNFGTKTITFQIFEKLLENAQYTLIIVGGIYGVLTMESEPALMSNYLIRFKTGTEIDPEIPFAKRDGFEGDKPFLGASGIYKQVYNKVGEPITHIVTTSGTVGPDGNIIPSADKEEAYIPPKIDYKIIINTSIDDGSKDIEPDDV